MASTSADTYSPSRDDFAARLSEHLGKPVRAVATPEQALVGADIMVEASRLTSPTILLRTEWVEPGTRVIPYGTISAVELSLTGVMDKIVVDDWGAGWRLATHVAPGRLPPRLGPPGHGNGPVRWRTLAKRPVSVSTR